MVFVSGGLAASWNVISAQSTRTIHGIVQHAATGETVPFATITIPGTGHTAQSNRDGFFSLLGAPADSVDLRIAHVGFVAETVPIPRGMTDRVFVELSPFSYLLEGLTVVADNYRMIQAAEGISQITASPEDLAVLPSIGEVDVFRSLQLLPGISGTQESSSGLFVRGGTPDQNLVLLDGMTVYHVDHFFGFFSAFNAEAIKDIQVYKAAYPAQFGGRVSSVVDMTGKAGDPNAIHATLGANLLSGNASIQIPLLGRGSFILTSRRSYTDVLQTPLYNDILSLFRDDQPAQTTTAGPAPGGQGGRRPGGVGAGRFQNSDFGEVNPDFYFYDVNGKLTLNVTQNDIFAASIYNGQDYLDNSRNQLRQVDTRQGLPREVDIDVADFTDWGNRGTSGKWARQWNPGLYSNGIVAYSEYFSDYTRNTNLKIRDPDSDTTLVAREFGGDENNFITDFTARIDNELQPAPGHKIGFGGSYTKSEVSYNFTRNDTLTILEQNQSGARVSGYLQNTWQLRDRLSLTFGGRVAFDDLTSRQYWEPRASATFAVSPRVTLKGGIGRYHQFVNRVVNENVTEGARDFWLLADGDLVQVTSSDHFVAGIAFETDGLLLDIEAYRKNTSGLSEFSLRFQRARDPDPLNLFFEGTGVATGAEFLLQKKVGRWTGWTSYTLSQVEHIFPKLNDGMPFPALHDQRHELKIVSTLDLGRFTFSGTWAYGTGKPYTAPESEYSLTLLDGREQGYVHVSEKNSLRLPAYHRADVAAHYRVPIGPLEGDIGLSVFNLYNHTNVWYREFDLNSTPVLVTDVTYLGMTPLISFRLAF